MSALLKSNTEMTGRKTDGKRVLYIDIIKGLAVFLMVWGHCIQYCSNNGFDFFENPVFKMIYSFHMPLFMLVSGYLFAFSCRKRELKDLLIHRTQGLVQPIVMCTLFNYILTSVIFSGHPTNIIGGNWIKELNSLWFLWSVLSASIIIGIGYKSFRSLFARIVIAGLGFLFVRLFPCYDLNTFMYPYFLLGFIFAFIKNKLPRIIVYSKYLSLVLFPVMLMFYEKKHYIYITEILSKDYDAITMLKLNLFRWSIGVVGSICVLVLVEVGISLMQKFSLVNKIGITISLLGKKSLQVYCISISLLSWTLSHIYPYICSLIGYNILSQNMILYSCFYTLIIAICFSFLLYFIVKFFEKTKIDKVLFGR